MEEVLKGKSFLMKDAFRMAWPAVLESFFVSLAGMIDTMMVSSLGTAAVSSVGLTTQPKFIALTLFLAINVAISALVARRYGQKDKKNANEIFVTSMIFVIVACIIVSFASVAFTDHIIEFCGSNPETHAGAVTYFIVIQAGMIFNVLSLAINAAQRGSGNTKIAMTTNVTSSIVNICFNYLLIEGHFGFPRLGLFGAALATVLGTVVAFIMSLISILKKGSFISLGYIIKEKIRPSFAAFKTTLSLSNNFFIENLVMRVGFLVTSILAAGLGTDAFAAHQVGMNILSLSFSFGDGMQVAAVALIGQSLGRKEKKLAKTYGSICQMMGLAMGVVIMIIMIFFGKDVFSLFFKETHVIDMGILISYFIAAITIFQISQIVYAGCLRGAGDARYTLFGSLVSVAIIRSVVTWALVGGIFDLGLTGIWIGVFSDQFARFLFFTIRYHKGQWVDISI